MKSWRGKLTGTVAGLLVFAQFGSYAYAAEPASWVQESTGVLGVKHVASYSSGAKWDKSGAEIIAYDAGLKRAYVVNGYDKRLEILDLSGLKAGQSLTSLTHVQKITLGDLDARLGKTTGPTSVAVSPKGDVVAVAVPNDPEQENGHVALLDRDGKLIRVLEVGALPDMLIFTPDGSKVLTANEGQPSADYTVDPEGSVTVIDLSAGAAQAKATTVRFDDPSVIADDVRIGKPGAAAAFDIEPEYIAVAKDGKTAYVTLQENNAVAVLDLGTNKFTQVKGLGVKDHSVSGNGFDASNKDKAVNIRPWPVLGLYMPDGAETYSAQGKTYLVTANEGDTRDYETFSEETRVADEAGNLALKAEHYKGYTQEQLDGMVKDGLYDEAQLGRLLMTNTMGQGADGQYNAIYGLGARSFSIWDTSDMSLVYDSGEDFERITAKVLPKQFNASNSKLSFDDRSDDKGPEPEDVKIGEIAGKSYAFIGLERVGGIMVYDISDPAKPLFATYFNSRDFTQENGGDSGPEGLRFVPAEQSPTGNALLLVGYEVSGTVGVYEITPASGSAGSGEQGTKISIVHVNDMHSRVEESAEHIGYAKLSSVIKEIRASNPNTLVLDAGDTLHGQTIANLVRGESIVSIMNAIGFDAMTTGNHDYNYGSSRLVELAGQANYPMLAANVYKADGSRLLEPYVVKTVGGVRVGIFGLATPETLYKTHPKNVEGLTFADPVEEGRRMVAELEGKADVVVALSHLGLDTSSVDTSLKLAEQVKGIDVIIDGHSHTMLENGRAAGGTLIAQTGEYGKNVGVVELTVNGQDVTNKEARLISRKQVDAVQPDPAVADIVKKVKEEQEIVLSEAVGRSTVNLVGERDNVRTGETNLGNLITDAMLDETGADVAITNGGGIRASIPAGSITKGQVITVLPFGNYIQTKRVTGADLLAALEHGVGAYPDSAGSFPHVGGMTFAIDPSKPKGARVQSLQIGSEPVDLNKTYLMATNDFMAAGGDQYTMFKDQPLAGDYSSLEESVIRYIQKTGEVNVGASGRVTVAAGTDAGASPAAPGGDTAPEALPNVYVVKQGDSLWRIAKQYGTTWQLLQQLNKLANPNRIYPDQQIVLP
ncbi:choice-of-anchor I family protein [Paenibacillus sp. GYB004]|uniref:choice-of-anchor I family protein n=1 Tax=Paenibacillus sp. GYB004 TaxID=2994393 RepID=UPI002F962415